jgi:hypothetical protein
VNRICVEASTNKKHAFDYQQSSNYQHLFGLLIRIQSKQEKHTFRNKTGFEKGNICYRIIDFIYLNKLCKFSLNNALL